MQTRAKTKTLAELGLTARQGADVRVTGLSVEPRELAREMGLLLITLATVYRGRVPTRDIILVAATATVLMRLPSVSVANMGMATAMIVAPTATKVSRPSSQGALCRSGIGSDLARPRTCTCAS